jgi:hypothetical protein
MSGDRGSSQVEVVAFAAVEELHDHCLAEHRRCGLARTARPTASQSTADVALPELHLCCACDASASSLAARSAAKAKTKKTSYPTRVRTLTTGGWHTHTLLANLELGEIVRKTSSKHARTSDPSTDLFSLTSPIQYKKPIITK